MGFIQTSPSKQTPLFIICYVPIPQVMKSLSLCVWLVAAGAVKGEWRSGLTEHGALSATPIFPCMMLKSSVMCWAIMLQKTTLTPVSLVPGNTLHCSPSGAQDLRSRFKIAIFPIPPV